MASIIIKCLDKETDAEHFSNTYQTESLTEAMSQWLKDNVYLDGDDKLIIELEE